MQDAVSAMQVIIMQIVSPLAQQPGKGFSMLRQVCCSVRALVAWSCRRTAGYLGKSLTLRHQHPAHCYELGAGGQAAVLQRLVGGHQAPLVDCALPGVLEALHPAAHERVGPSLKEEVRPQAQDRDCASALHSLVHCDCSVHK